MESELVDLGHGHATPGLRGLPEPRSLSPVTRVNDTRPATSLGRVITLSRRPLGGPLLSQPPSSRLSPVQVSHRANGRTPELQPNSAPVSLCDFQQDTRPLWAQPPPLKTKGIPGASVQVSSSSDSLRAMGRGE